MEKLRTNVNIGQWISFYIAMHMNGMLLILYLEGVAGTWLLVGLQLLLVGLLAFLSKKYKWLPPLQKNKLLDSLKNVLVAFFIMIGVSVGLSFLMNLFSTTSSNQGAILSLQEQLPIQNFLFYLLLASVFEELFYRQAVYQLFSTPIFSLVVSSFWFAYSHHINALIVFIIYFFLGLILGKTREKEGIYASICLHILWNSFVFIMS